MRVVHVTTGLDLGGAETVLVRLIEGTRRRSDAVVISLHGRGALAAPIEELGVEVIALDDGLRSPWKVRAALRAAAPDVVQTWMYHADVIGGTLQRIAGRAPVVWGIHAGVLDPSGARARAAIRGAAVLSHVVPERIICCSETSYRVHVERGYARKKMVVIDNGFDVPDPMPDAAASVRAELGLPPDARLIGRPGRYHPQKDHATLLRAFADVRRRRPGTWLLLAGPGMDEENGELRSLVARTAPEGGVLLLGVRQDVPRLDAACDVVVSSSSFGEALPLIIGESMAGGTPVVATDVGDSARIVGDTGWVVPVGDAGSLADALVAALDEPAAARADRGERSRQRIVSHFAAATMCERYLQVYEELAS